MAEKAMGVWISLTEHRIGSMFSHFGYRSGLFALAASGFESDWKKSTMKLAEHHRAFRTAKILSETNPWLKKVTDASPFNFQMVAEIANVYVAPSCFSNGWIKFRLQQYAREVFLCLGRPRELKIPFR